MDLEIKIIWRAVKNGLNLDLKKDFWRLKPPVPARLLSFIMCKIKKSLWVTNKIMNLETKIIWQAFMSHKRRKYFLKAAITEICYISFLSNIIYKISNLETKSQIIWRHIFSYESGFVTFLRLSKANFMQKNMMVGNMRAFVTDRRTDG